MCHSPSAPSNHRGAPFDATPPSALPSNALTAGNRVSRGRKMGGKVDVLSRHSAETGEEDGGDVAEIGAVDTG